MPTPFMVPEMLVYFLWLPELPIVRRPFKVSEMSGFF
jgi:hypothetical protein